MWSTLVVDRCGDVLNSLEARFRNFSRAEVLGAEEVGGRKQPDLFHVFSRQHPAPYAPATPPFGSRIH